MTIQHLLSRPGSSAYRAATTPHNCTTAAPFRADVSDPAQTHDLVRRSAGDDLARSRVGGAVQVNWSRWVLAQLR